MNDLPTVYEKAVTTDRPAEMLAQRHGFENVAQLAESLPPGAQVLDVGAGASPFGKEVATLRPDVTWVNFDYSYNNPKILADVAQGAPDNVKYVAGDATKLAEAYQPETFDAIFSYWLLPHLSIDDPAPAKAAAKAMFSLAKVGGTISVGPETSKKRLPSLKSGQAHRVEKDQTTDADSFAETVLDVTRLQGVGQYTQRLANEVATPFFGTTRYAKREGRIPRVYDPEKGDYVSPLSRRGVKVAGKLAIALAGHVKQQRKTKH